MLPLRFKVGVDWASWASKPQKQKVPLIKFKIIISVKANFFSHNIVPIFQSQIDELKDWTTFNTVRDNRGREDFRVFVILKIQSPLNSGQVYYKVCLEIWIHF